ncbi:uncharacterized protein Z518_08680 [Rhinocladiella mackenziei CBS 650.93]|uniref:Uncharacterized protein n=1 Tax=Rhinocladiella mackenziei CBS 650.93 TaxID=1442369 RepID=A0A0D2GWY6_9EURO|nr:uncharacterized protein Z518_08680 [Rhinocladiella mackenziei CBS 650.93]KIX02738.1 hypothetical protein Z518_08680 [Rhinocladiella mackenziei CBS 650.93]
MVPTPVHIKHIRGPGRRISSYKDELVKVQSLYLDRRFKQCIGLCEQLQKSDIHPLHQAFLWFYHAICYESIGLMAHDFSSKKLQFLGSAKESFILALQSLPLPYVSAEGGRYEQPDHSPLSLVFATPCVQRMPAEVGDVASPSLRPAEIAQSISSGSIYSTENAISESCTAVDSDEPLAENLQATFTPRTHMAQKESSKCNYSTTTPCTPTTHKSRLIQSLSSTHVLAEELVPSPLFSRKPKRARTTQLTAQTLSDGGTPFRVSGQSLGDRMPGGTEQLCLDTESSDSSPTLRQLPPLPFNHKPSFKIQGARLVQIPSPMRQTAVQTLIAKSEGFLPFPPSPLLQPLPWTSHADTETFSMSPGTPRFKLVRDAFSPSLHNEHLEGYLSSVGVTTYNTSLVDFRTQFRKHITYLDEEMCRVRKARGEHAAAKTLSKTRLASYWSFEHVASASKSKFTETQQHGRGCGLGDNEDPQVKTKKERIERLGRKGWRVRKEDHGFKGIEWYENLRSRVEVELDRYAMRRFE